MRKALAVGRKELRQIVRDRRTLLILVFVPAFFLLLYGYALNFDIRHIALAVEDRDGTPESREVVSAFINSGYFDLVAPVHSPAEAGRLLDLNTARAVKARNDASMIAFRLKLPAHSPTQIRMKPIETS